MIRKYWPVLDIIQAAASLIGMSIRENDEFSAEFERPDGWRLVVLGERYARPLFNVSVKPPLSREAFSLRILMSVHTELHGYVRKPPSLMNQLDFLVAHIDGWLANTSLYEERYREINEATWRLPSNLPGRSF